MEFVFAGRLLLACFVIAALLYGFAYFVRLGRRLPRSIAGGSRPGRLTTVVETTLLPDAASLHVVRFADRYLLLGRSASHVSLLYEMSAESLPRADPG